MAHVRWSPELVTEVNRLNYDFDSFIGELHMPPGCNCDMGGCLNLFKRIDLKVKLIRTYAGGMLDTVYCRESAGWKAYLVKREICNTNMEAIKWNAK